MLWVRISISARCTTLCYKVCQGLVTGWWFSLGPPVSSINKTDCHDITEILLKVALNTIKQTNICSFNICVWLSSDHQVMAFAKTSLDITQVLQKSFILTAPKMSSSKGTFPKPDNKDINIPMLIKVQKPGWQQLTMCDVRTLLQPISQAYHVWRTYIITAHFSKPKPKYSIRVWCLD